jgi:hypothetical protein
MHGLRNLQGNNGSTPQRARSVTLQRKGIRVIQAIFEELLEDGDELLPWEHRDKMLSTLSNQEKTRICCDFIACFAIAKLECRDVFLIRKMLIVRMARYERKRTSV